MSLVLDNQQHS